MSLPLLQRSFSPSSFSRLAFSPVLARFNSSLPIVEHIKTAIVIGYDPQEDIQNAISLWHEKGFTLTHLSSAGTKSLFIQWPVLHTTLVFEKKIEPKPES